MSLPTREEVLATYPANLHEAVAAYRALMDRLRDVCDPHLVPVIRVRVWHFGQLHAKACLAWPVNPQLPLPPCSGDPFRVWDYDVGSSYPACVYPTPYERDNPNLPGPLKLLVIELLPTALVPRRLSGRSDGLRRA